MTDSFSASILSDVTLKNKPKVKEKTTLTKRREISSDNIDSSKLSEYPSSIISRMLYRFKVILLGDIAVGKSSLIKRFIEDKYNHEYHVNVGVEFKVKSIFIDINTGADLQVWDTCGEERFRTLTRQYYTNTHGIILIFDLTDKNSFFKLSSWMEEIKNFAPKNVDKILIGNKSDMIDERMVSINEANHFANKNNLPYMEASAFTGNNVGNIFENLTKMMIQTQVEKANKERKKQINGKGKKDSTKSIILSSKSFSKSQTRNSSKCC
jgi:Ras-related protein Rab-1A